MLNTLRRHVLAKWVALAVVLTTGSGHALPAGPGARTDTSDLSDPSDRAVGRLCTGWLRPNPLVASFAPSRELVNDANGNTLSGGGRLNTWDSQNRLVKCVNGGNTSLFTYGSDGIRRTGVVNGTTTHYALDNGMLVREMTGALTSKATYLLGPRGPEYRRDDPTDSVKWYVFDGLGSVVAEVDLNGNMTTPRRYDVYGNVRSGDAGTSKQKFVGSLGHTTEADGETGGMIYMRARWMDPAVGRFVSEDPARDGENWYSYCAGDPVNAVDPDGRLDASVLMWLWDAVTTITTSGNGTAVFEPLKQLASMELQVLKSAFRRAGAGAVEIRLSQLRQGIEDPFGAAYFGAHGAATMTGAARSLADAVEVLSVLRCAEELFMDGAGI